MKKYLIPLLLAGWTAGSAAAQDAGYVDDLYRGSTRQSRAVQQERREIQRSARLTAAEQRNADRMPAQWTPARQTQTAAPVTAAAQGAQRNELVTSFDDALQRRIAAYRNYREMDDDYWKLMESFHRTLSGRYDPDLYNVITFGNDMWVEPTYITALFDGSDPTARLNAKELWDGGRDDRSNVNITLNVSAGSGWADPWYAYWGSPWSRPWRWNYYYYGAWGGPYWSWSWNWGPSWSWGSSWSWGPGWGWGPSWG